jgi:DNA-binding NarL/FixJ family response regulator
MPIELSPVRVRPEDVYDAPARGREPYRPPERTAQDEILRLLREVLQRLDRLEAGPGAPGALPARSPAPLTGRQAEILGLVAAGRSTEEIAAELWLSVATVRNHISRSIRALGAHSRTQAIAHARERGILP